MILLSVIQCILAFVCIILSIMLNDYKDKKVSFTCYIICFIASIGNVYYLAQNGVLFFASSALFSLAVIVTVISSMRRVKQN